MALRRRATNALGVVLLVGVAIMVNVVISRHGSRWDWTRVGRYALAKKTESALRGLSSDIRLTFVAAQDSRDDAQSATRELLARMGRSSARLTLRMLDVDRSASVVELLTRRYRLDTTELRAGLVIVAGKRRHRVVPLRRFVRVVPHGTGRRLISFAGESFLLSAVLGVAKERRPLICFTTGHGEASIESYRDPGIALLADEVRREGYLVEAVGPDSLARRLEDCAVTAIIGPTRTLSSVALDLLEAKVKGGGRILVQIGPLLDRGLRRYGEVGLERMLSRLGVSLPRNVIVDPRGVLGEAQWLTWGTRWGYGDHAVVSSLRGKTTVWPLSRQVRASGLGGGRFVPLVKSSARSWAKEDLQQLRNNEMAFDKKRDRAGPLTVAAALTLAASKMVVMGCERGVLNRRLKGGVIRDYNRDLFLNALAWLTEQPALLGVSAKPPERLRVSLDGQGLFSVLMLSVVALPLMAGAIGLIAWWRRRR